MSCCNSSTPIFLSTPSARRATHRWPHRDVRRGISIHALREEGDILGASIPWVTLYFYPRPPRGGRLGDSEALVSGIQFLSTPSARRATRQRIYRRGSDEFLSTPSARRATLKLTKLRATPLHFYPRPPRGGRPLSVPASMPTLLYFYPRPPRGGRLPDGTGTQSAIQFLSTPSARRATVQSSTLSQSWQYFYPRPPRGGRHTGRPGRVRTGYFYPRPPRGGRPYEMQQDYQKRIISIHALREEGDRLLAFALASFFVFLSTPSARRATAKTEKNISAFVSL